MRKTLATLLNLVGLALLVSAALIAWNAYNPITPAPPADVTVVDETQPGPLPPSASLPEASTTLPAPAILPESRAPAATSEAPRDEAPDLAARKQNYSDLAKQRAQAFPPPATNTPNRIVIPALNVDSKVIEVGWKTTILNSQAVSEWEVADYAVGYHKGSALLGAAGNTVMSGHNNINGEVFKHLIDLKIGDEIFVYADDRAYRYLVAQKLLLKEAGVSLAQRLQNAQWIAPTDDVRLTLVSCWPYNNNTHRVIIVAKPANS